MGRESIHLRGQRGVLTTNLYRYDLDASGKQGWRGGGKKREKGGLELALTDDRGAEELAVHPAVRGIQSSCQLVVG
jgi:hypothetical protein